MSTTSVDYLLADIGHNSKKPVMTKDGLIWRQDKSQYSLLRFNRSELGQHLFQQLSQFAESLYFRFRKRFQR
jgi:hypothetical protein